MVSYLYKRDYAVQAIEKMVDTSAELRERRATNGNSILISHAHVYGTANYYDFPKLQSMAVKRFTVHGTHDSELDGFIEVVRSNLVDLTEDDTFMTQLAAIEEAQPFAADMLCQVVRSQLKEGKEASTAMLKADIDIKDLTRRIEQLEYDLESAKRDAAAERCCRGRVGGGPISAREQSDEGAGEWP
ncbi:hypothetical protein BAUCODRAFT_156448 [Baudoinia panamericana UAMH 10762]|uniref:Uncharacterized protein n=1 Tax=Baudoinia panamericana (strain UAMH 10762) TaxID=717646 RepID=M2MHX8_BAUPA|nr:uncharacterized protein BAUCODRAFT_156448 [Baudoinia panamericana UAMH 10762]EMC96246.1 hypothetical protein BAUCODRAFT_156448 [Baudoinia panamericana UAMH 10762]